LVFGPEVLERYPHGWFVCKSERIDSGGTRDKRVQCLDLAGRAYQCLDESARATLRFGTKPAATAKSSAREYDDQYPRNAPTMPQVLHAAIIVENLPLSLYVKPPILIDSEQELAHSLHALSTAAWVALDTEFVRERTYRARLCLVQIATPDVLVCVDPLRVDVAPLLEALYQPTLLKVLHSARQDLEVLYDVRGAVLSPIFDTQIAAALTGPEDQIGYGALVERLTGHRLDKQATRTDWSQRPLTDAQLAYARDDVHYLREVYAQLAARLEALGRREWLDEECAAMTDPALYAADPAEAWRRIRAGQHLGSDAQQRLAALAEWRERTARERDLPRGWIVKDPALIELASNPPPNLAALAQHAGMTPAILRKWGSELLARLNAAAVSPPRRLWENPARPDIAQAALLKRWSDRVKALADAEGLSATLLATRHDLQELLLTGGGRLARGWRKGFLGDELSRERAGAMQT
jgi:ribonuclease D